MSTDTPTLTTGNYVCTLRADLVEKAEKELNEKDQWRQRDIDALREMIVKDKSKCYIRF